MNQTIFDSLLDNYATTVKAEFALAIEQIYKRSWGDRIKELIGGLVAHQASLVLLLAGSPLTHNVTIAPVYLRAMLEIVIKTAWLMAAPGERGLALIRDELSSLEDTLKKSDQFCLENQIDLSAMVDTKGTFQWLDEQDSEFHYRTTKTERHDPRKMAITVGGETLQLYRTYYILFSSSLHSTWDHISKNDSVINPNPLHRYHFVPTISFDQPSVIFAVLAAELFESTIAFLLGKEDFSKRAYSVLLKGLQEPEDANQET